MPYPGEPDPEPAMEEDADSNFIQSTVLEDLAQIDAVVAELESTSSISDVADSKFDSFGGGDSGGAGASDNFDGGANGSD